MSFKESIFIIADSNANDRQAFKHILQAAGANKITFVSDDRAALRELEATRVDQIVFVIYDMDTPKLNTVEFAKKVRSNWNSPNRFAIIIGISRDVDIDLVHQARDAGIHGFLIKPVSGAKAMGRINQIIRELRPYVETKTFFGPDRRRPSPVDHQGEDFRRDQKPLLEAPWKAALLRAEKKAAVKPVNKPSPPPQEDTPAETIEDTPLPRPPRLRRPPPSLPPSANKPAEAMEWTDMAAKAPPPPQPVAEEPGPTPEEPEISPADVAAATQALEDEAKSLLGNEQPAPPPPMPTVAPPPPPKPSASPWAGLERPDLAPPPEVAPPTDPMAAAQSTVVYDSGPPVQNVQFADGFAPPSAGPSTKGPTRGGEPTADDEEPLDDSGSFEPTDSEQWHDDQPANPAAPPHSAPGPSGSVGGGAPSGSPGPQNGDFSQEPGAGGENIAHEAPISQKDLLNALLNGDSKGQNQQTEAEHRDPGKRPTISQQDLLATLTKRSTAP
ncbi:response regulator [Magnetospira sp. QH-2]|uniref:response regulator n=1 Tax=Magnetospira sp. (strain QH-2) TaxID=1288970 RepID=UPI0003E80DB8|nr:response regulator [Magnetospira sp. QH-2]CCQ73238.1 Protein of unknown function [Magnetospira sp. QH-2]